MSTAIAFLLIAIYVGGVVFFSKKTQATFTASGRWLVVAMWPVFLVLSPRFREKLKG